jgi:DNA-binding protein HU-beta
VNKSQLIDALAARYEGNRKQAQHALESVLDTITREVARGEKVAITGFGSFEKRVREARMVRNPQTGERIRAKKKAVPKFTAGADLKNVVSGAKKLPRLTLAAGSAAAKRATAPAKKASATKSTAAKKSAPAKKASATRSTAAKRTAPAKKTAAKKSTATKSTATKSTATRKTAPAKKTAAKKSAPAKKTAAKKSTAKKATATKSTATRSSAAKRSAPAKKTAKKTARRS